jgi:hypothetical protein
VENYFNYFTEIEEHFQRRWGGSLLLSTLDWALIETWKDSGIPLEAVLRGIDRTFEHYEQRPVKTRKVNSLGYCAQEVLGAAEDMKEAAVGTQGATSATPSGFDSSEIVIFLRRNADQIESAKLPVGGGVAVEAVAKETANTLRETAAELEKTSALPRLEDLERKLTVLEEKLLSALLVAAPDKEIVSIRAQADRELAPYRSKMPGAQIDQLYRQYINKRLLDQYKLPRLSLFYM